MIIDCHVHIHHAGREHLETVLDAADRAGVDKLCISSLSRQWTEFPTLDQLEEAASDVLEACALFPDRFIGGVYVSADHVETSLALMDRCIGNGPCRFIKWWVSQYADDPRLNPIVERSIELGVPILAHTWTKATGNMTRESTCHHALAMAKRYPRMKIWIAHFSGRWEEAARVVRDQPNVCIDLSGGEPEDGILDGLLKHVGPDRIFFGSDAPGRSFVVQMSKVLSADIGDAERKMILGDNVKAWLHV
jgi:predicted TIM-barrel fold metal-dependent hydrolase